MFMTRKIRTPRLANIDYLRPSIQKKKSSKIGPKLYLLFE